MLLLFSGGLDTSVMCKWIQDEYEAEVVALTINLGQPGEDYDVVKQKALDLGAVAAEVIDAREEFARDFVTPSILANGTYGLGYPLFTALGRPLIAKLAVEDARRDVRLDQELEVGVRGGGIAAVDPHIHCAEDVPGVRTRTGGSARASLESPGEDVGMALAGTDREVPRRILGEVCEVLVEVFAVVGQMCDSCDQVADRKIVGQLLHRGVHVGPLGSSASVRRFPPVAVVE